MGLFIHDTAVTSISLLVLQSRTKLNGNNYNYHTYQRNATFNAVEASKEFLNGRYHLHGTTRIENKTMIKVKRDTFFHNELAPSHMPKSLKRPSRRTVKFNEEKPHRPRLNLSTEMIVRHSIHQTYLEYMVNSSLSGVRFLVDSTKTAQEKCMWFAIIGCAAFCFFYFVKNSLDSQNAQPAYMTLEDADYPVRNIIFPAFAVCNHNRLKKSAVSRLVDVLYSYDNTTFPSKHELFEIVTMYGNLYDFSYSRRADISRYNVFLERIENLVDKRENVRKSDISNLLLSLSPSCEETLLRCIWKGVITNCSVLFRTALTQFGYCCIFNYYDTEAGRLVVDPLDPVDKPYVLERANPYYGLMIAAYAKTDEYLYTTRQAYGFDLLFFDRYDYADQTAGGLVHKVVSVGEQYDMVLNPYAYYTVPAIKKFALDERKCKFSDEMQSEYHNHYSMSNCLVRCRMRTIERLCRCIPFFLPRRSNLSACTLEELYCLNKYSQKLLFIYPPEDLPGLEIERENSLNCPQCMADCTATRYKVMNTRIMQIPTNSTQYFKGINVRDGNVSVISLYYSSESLPLYRVDVTVHWYEVVSYLGGLCGFFTGFSMISLAELFYFIFIRFYYILVYNFKQNSNN